MNRHFLRLVACAWLLLAINVNAQSLPEVGVYLNMATQTLAYVDADDQSSVIAMQADFVVAGHEARDAMERVRERAEAYSFSEFPTFSDPDDDTILNIMGLARDAAMFSALAEWTVVRFAEGNTVTNQLTAHMALTNAVAAMTEADVELSGLLPILDSATIPAHPVARITGPVSAAPGELATLVVTIVNVGDVAAQNVLARISSIPSKGSRAQEVELGQLAPQQTMFHVFNVSIPDNVADAVFTVQVLGDNNVFPRTSTIIIQVEVP